MSVLAPTPPERMVDSAGRPYFLWDDDMSMETFRSNLRDPDPEVRAYFVGKRMRQAKPDDVFSFVTVEEIEAQWDLIERYLGKTREFWRWLLDRWAVAPHVDRSALGWSRQDIDELARFRDELVERVVAASKPTV